MNPFTFFRNKFTPNQIQIMNIFIGSIPWKASHSDLKTLFDNIGEVTKFTMCKDKETQKFKGYGFVEMSDSDGARAISKLNNIEFGGRKLIVKEANPRPER